MFTNSNSHFGVSWTDDYSIIGEVKSRDVKKFSKKEAVELEKKFAEVKKMEKIERAVPRRPMHIAGRKESLAVKMRDGWKPGR